MNNLKINYFVDIIIFTSFVMVAGSGILISVLPSARNFGEVYNSFWGLNKHSWIEIHEWAGIVMSVFICLHIGLHWKWIVAETKNFFIKD